MTGNEITVCIAAHPARAHNGMLDRALDSVWKQTRLPHQVVVQMDCDKEGGHVTHNKAIQGVTTPWIAMLDSDDEFMPQHLENLLACALEQDADFVYSWFEVVGGPDPFPKNFGKPWDDAHPITTTITVLCRTEIAQRVGFRSDVQPGTKFKYGQIMGEDDVFVRGFLEEGAKIVHHPERTWRWHHHGANTSSNPLNGDAR